MYTEHISTVEAQTPHTIHANTPTVAATAQVQLSQHTPVIRGTMHQRWAVKCRGIVLNQCIPNSLSYQVTTTTTWQWVHLPCPISCCHENGSWCCCYLRHWLIMKAMAARAAHSSVTRLWDRWSGVLFLTGERNFSLIYNTQTKFGTPKVSSYAMGIVDKAARPWGGLLTPH